MSKTLYVCVHIHVHTRGPAGVHIHRPTPTSEIVSLFFRPGELLAQAQCNPEGNLTPQPSSTLKDAYLGTGGLAQPALCSSFSLPSMPTALLLAPGTDHGLRKEAGAQSLEGQ